MMRFQCNIIICTLAACTVFVVADSVRLEERPVDAKAKIKLPDAVEKALTELATEAAKIKRELRIEEMKKIIAEISEVTKISDEQKKKLEDEVKPAVERSLMPWKEEFDSKLRPYLSKEGEGGLAMLSNWRAEQLVPSGFPGDFGKPEEDTGWKEALKKTLSIEQYDDLHKIAVERERKFKEQIADYLKPMIEQTRQARAVVLAREIEDMRSILALSEDRVKQLEKMADASVERACELMCKRATKTLGTMQEQQRASIITSGRSIFNVNDEVVDEADTGESSQGIWVNGITSILKDDDRKRWEAAAGERSDRSARALAMLFVAEMDQHVLFSSWQRAKMELIATKELADKSKKKSNNEAVNLMQAALFNAREVKAVLDSGQWGRWEAAGRGEYNGRTGIRRNTRNGAGEGKKEDASTQKIRQETPDDETLFATHFEKHLVVKRIELAAALGARVDDVRRVVKFSPDRSMYLEIAAKGAVEHALDAWRAQFDSWTRNSVQGAKGEALRTRLAALDNDGIWFGDEGMPGDHVVWKEALAEALTPEQKNILSAELVARATYRQHAYSWGILAELNRRYHFSIDQFGKLEPLVESAVAEYFDDFMNMFGRGSSSVMPRYLVTLFTAVPEDSLRTILNDRQWKQWRQVDSKQVAPWWESMKSNHQRKIQKK